MGHIQEILRMCIRLRDKMYICPQSKNNSYESKFKNLGETENTNKGPVS